MADPQRFLNQISDADEFERKLLGSLQRVQPPADAKSEAWARIEAQVAAVALVSATLASTAAAGSTATAAASSAGSPLTVTPLVLKALGSKLTLGLALAGSVLGASALLWTPFHSRPAPSVASVAPPARATLPEPIPAAIATEEPATAPRIAVPASERPAKASAEPNASDRLNAESALLTQARAQLRRGDTAEAERSLARLRANFPKGVLGQEREVLAIELLLAQGNTEAARRRANAFIAAHPKSPHSPQLSRLAGDP